MTSTIPPSPGPYPGVSSVPATTPAAAPAPGLAKDVDQKPVESPKRENVDSNSNLASESNDGPVETDLKEVAIASVATDQEMADTVSTDPKEEPMDVDGPQPSGTLAAEEGSKENASEVSAVKEEWQMVDAADVSAAAPTETETSPQTAPRVDRNESEGGFAASRL